MQHISYKHKDFGDVPESRIALLCHYRGAVWGMLAGGPVGLATALNLSLSDPAMTLGSIVALWLAGGICGHNMQTLLEGTR